MAYGVMIEGWNMSYMRRLTRRIGVMVIVTPGELGL